MRALQVSGLGRLVQTPAPLGEWAAQALACWYWCKGWEPERWASYAAFHDVPDWHALIDLMKALREALEASRQTGAR